MLGNGAQTASGSTAGASGAIGLDAPTFEPGGRVGEDPMGDAGPTAVGVSGGAVAVGWKASVEAAVASRPAVGPNAGATSADARW